MVKLDDVQGNILRGYRKNRVRHVVTQVVNAAKARAWVGATLGSDRNMAPAVTTAAHWGERPPDVCVNLGFTFAGLVALGVPEATAQSFPQAYREGMAARASKIGDWGAAAPEHWRPWFRDSAIVHLIVTMYANTTEQLDRQEQVLASGLGAQALTILGRDEGFRFDGDQVHFGYRDNIAEPRFAHVHAPEKYDDQPIAPLGTVLVGYPTAYEEVVFSVPAPQEFGLNGAFNAYRVLEQDVRAFEAYLDTAAEQVLASDAADELLPPGTEAHFGPHATRMTAMREVVASKLLGRWRNGTPLVLSPHNPTPHPSVPINNFDYTEDGAGLKCPMGSHIRRANPRGGKIVQRVANHTRRLVRRGVPYGPKFDPAAPDDIERGLLGSFMCADLAAQFEAVMYDWVNLGLQDPRITGSNDPLLGANDPEASWFDLPASKGPIRLRGLPRFIRTRGGAYTFMPGVSGLRWLSRMTA